MPPTRSLMALMIPLGLSSSMSSVVNSLKPTSESCVRSSNSERRVRIPAWIEDVLEMRPSVEAFQKNEPWVCRSTGQLQPFCYWFRNPGRTTWDCGVSAPVYIAPFQVSDEDSAGVSCWRRRPSFILLLLTEVRVKVDDRDWAVHFCERAQNRQHDPADSKAGVSRLRSPSSDSEGRTCGRLQER